MPQQSNLVDPVFVAPTGGGRRASMGVARGASRVARTLVKCALASTSGGLNRMLGGSVGRQFGVLTYHRVIDPIRGVARPTWNIRPADLRKQLTGLLRAGFQAVPLRWLLEDRDGEKSFPAQAFVVTFDDAHESVYLNALPILKQLNIPATIFLSTAYLDSQAPFPFDDWSAAGASVAPIETWRPLSRAQCQEMAANDLIDLAAHTHTHQRFCDRPEDFRSDLAENIDTLVMEFGVTNAPFAFPFGESTPEMIEIVRAAGLTCAFSMMAALNDPLGDPLHWGRFDVASWDSAATLGGKLNGWYSWAPQLRAKWHARSQNERSRDERTNCATMAKDH